jgi:2,3-bisphosphoglycerate-dependent phosphoglycerate mutase
MGWPRRLVLIRHGQSQGNVLTVEERVNLDVSTYKYQLTDTGRRQAAITAESVHRRFPEGFDGVFSSYYDRAKETAQIVFPDACIREDSLLAEANRGIWHMMTHEQVAARYPEEIARKERDGYYHYRPLGGENWPDIEQRVRIFLLMLANEYDGQNVCIVGHGHLFVCFQRVVDGISIEEAITRYRTHYFDNASVTTYRPRSVNHRPHLVLAKGPEVPWKGKIEVAPLP